MTGDGWTLTSILQEGNVRFGFIICENEKMLLQDLDYWGKEISSLKSELRNQLRIQFEVTEDDNGVVNDPWEKCGPAQRLHSLNCKVCNQRLAPRLWKGPRAKKLFDAWYNVCVCVSVQSVSVCV